MKAFTAGIETAYEGSACEIIFTRHDLALDWARTLSERKDLPIRDHTKGEEPYYTTFQTSPDSPHYKRNEDYIFISSVTIYDRHYSPDWLMARR
jgi:hypothetical protein